MKRTVYHTTKIHRFQYPKAGQSKDILHSWILKHSTEWDISGCVEEKFSYVKKKHKGVRKTVGWNVFENYNPPLEFSEVIGFAHEKIFKLKKGYYTPAYGFDPGEPMMPLILTHAWGQYYNKGDYQESHNHVPNHWAWTYFVNTPPGSSPMCFDKPSKLQINVHEGLLLVFPAYLWHYVPPCNCDGRSIIVGNFAYDFRGEPIYNY